MPDFLPRRESDLVTWSVNFAARISAGPGAYGLTAEEAASFAAVQQAYAHWHAQANAPQTRTPVSLAMKHSVREALMGAARELAAKVRARRATTAEQMTDLGLHVRQPKRRRVPRPTEAPAVRFVHRGGGLDEVRVVQRLTGHCRRPAGVASAVLMIAVGSPPGEGGEGGAGDGPGDWHFWRTTGRLRELMNLPPSVVPGTKVWVRACWSTARGERGPWSQPSMIHANYGRGPQQRGVQQAA